MKVLGTSVLAGPLFFGTMLLASDVTVAKEIPVTSSSIRPQVVAIQEDNPMGQVNSVSQLSDVQPTDWAFQALQSLVERYGCIAGYPNGTFRGNRVMTRYEFAAGLHTCLSRINELIASSTSNLVKKEDLGKVQKLQEQFSTELAKLRGHVDALDARTAQLQANQFSTTTKLNGEAVVAIAGVAAGNRVNGQKVNKNTVIGDRVRLNLNTSFTGQDLLLTRLQASNLDLFSSTATFTPQGDFRFVTGNNNNRVVIDEVMYQFPLDKNTGVSVEANAGAVDDFTDTVHPYLDNGDDGGSGALTQFGTRNPIYYLLNGAGMGIRHAFNKKLELSLGYLANSASDPRPTSGIFSGSYGAIGQLTIKPKEGFTIGLTYINSYNNDFTANGSSGSTRANPIYGWALNPDIPSDPDLRISSNSYGVETSLQLSPKFTVGGWVGYTNTRTLYSPKGNIPRGSLDIWNYAVTLAFPDFIKKGNLAGIVVGMEPTVTGVSRSLRDAGINKDKDDSLHVEGFYQYKLSDNIVITPGIIWLTSPDNNRNNDDIVIGAVRTTFTF